MQQKCTSDRIYFTLYSRYHANEQILFYNINVTRDIIFNQISFSNNFLLISSENFRYIYTASFYILFRKLETGQDGRAV